LAVLLSFWAYTPILVRGRTVIFFSSFVKLLSIFRCCKAPSKLNNRRRFNALHNALSLWFCLKNLLEIFISPVSP